jgi:hypothetical protein
MQHIRHSSPSWTSLALRELLPLDATRRLEMEVYLALGTAAMTDPSLRTVHRFAQGAIRDVCDQVTALCPPPADTATEAAHLHALVDGLALHLVRQEPGEDSAWATTVLDAHLVSLMAHPGQSDRS